VVSVVLSVLSFNANPNAIYSVTSMRRKYHFWMIPGFDAIFAIAVLFAVAYLVLRERV